MNQVKLQTLEIVLHDNQINYETGDVVGIIFINQS